MPKLLVYLALGALLWLLCAHYAHDALRWVGFFRFLGEPSGFSIGEGWLRFESGDAYWLAFLAGLINTLRLALLAIVLSSLLGGVLGLGRLSHNLLLRALSVAYVEFFRNIPLLLQLLAWYFLLTELLPAANEAYSFASSFYLSKSGLAFPFPVWQSSPTGHFFFWDVPARQAWNIGGGARLTPEFLAVLLGLVCYSSAYLAEIVRAGVSAIPPGQSEAASALGLSSAQTLRRVVLPQALRIMLPPASNQFLNLLKNTSLGVAIGYPELVSVANTTLNQTGRALECVSLIVLIYLVISLTLSAFLAWFNQSLRQKAR
ncbi:MAG: ABC transporter permease subunit [Pseudomonadota bacterium]